MYGIYTIVRPEANLHRRGDAAGALGDGHNNTDDNINDISIVLLIILTLIIIQLVLILLLILVIIMIHILLSEWVTVIYKWYVHYSVTATW